MEEFSLYVNESNYNDCKPVVRRSIAYTCGEAQNFGDIYHEAWLALLKYIIKNKSFSFVDCRYLVIVSRRVCSKFLRKRGFSEELDPQIVEKEINDPLTPFIHTFDRIFIIQKNIIFGDENSDDQDIIVIPPLSKSEQELMENVGERCWKILLLRFYFSYSAEEIAKVMGWANPAVVYNEVYRCVRRAFEIIRELKNEGAWD